MMNETKYTYCDDLVSDLHKDAYNHRPSQGFWQEWGRMTPDQKQERWDRMVFVMEESMREEKALQAQAIAMMEEELVEIMNSTPNFSRADAIRYLARLHQCVYETGFVDLDELCWKLDLPFGHFYSVKNEVNPR